MRTLYVQCNIVAKTVEWRRNRPQRMRPPPNTKNSLLAPGWLAVAVEPAPSDPVSELRSRTRGIQAMPQAKDTAHQEESCMPNPLWLPVETAPWGRGVLVISLLTWENAFGERLVWLASQEIASGPLEGCRTPLGPGPSLKAGALPFLTVVSDSGSSKDHPDELRLAHPAHTSIGVPLKASRISVYFENVGSDGGVYVGCDCPIGTGDVQLLTPPGEASTVTTHTEVERARLGFGASPIRAAAAP